MGLPAKKPQRFVVSVRQYPERGGLVATNISEPQPTTLVGFRHVLMLMHGFNNTASAAHESYEILIGQLGSRLQQLHEPIDAILEFQWPGNVAVISFFKYLDFAGYPADISQALLSSQTLADYFRQLAAAGGALLKVSIIGHSLGCRLALEMMRNVANTPRPQLGMVALMAPAVPVTLVDSPQDPAAYLTSTDLLPQSLLKFHSTADVVLADAFPAGQTLAYLMNIESSPYLEAVGHLGNPANFGDSRAMSGNGHGDYWADPRVSNDIIAALDPTKQTRIQGRKLPVPRELPPRRDPENPVF